MSSGSGRPSPSRSNPASTSSTPELVPEQDHVSRPSSTKSSTSTDSASPPIVSPGLKPKGRVRFTAETIGDEDTNIPSETSASSSRNPSQSPTPTSQNSRTGSPAGFITPLSASSSSHHWTKSTGAASPRASSSKASSSSKAKIPSPLTSPPILLHDSPLQSPTTDHQGDYFSQVGSTGRSFTVGSSTPTLVLTRPGEHKPDLSKTTVENTLRNGGRTQFDDRAVRQQLRRSYGPVDEEDNFDGASSSADSEHSETSQALQGNRGIGGFYDSAVSSESSNNLLPNVPAPAILHHLGNIMDVGLRTSGGLAPGAVNYEAEQNLNDMRNVEFGEPSLLERRRGSLDHLTFRALPQQDESMPNSIANSISSTPGSERLGETPDAIPLSDLDRKLSNLQAELDPEAQETARMLVQGHLHRSDTKGKKKLLSPTDDNMSDYGFVIPNMEYLQRTGSRGEDELRNEDHDQNKTQTESSEYYGEDIVDGNRTPMYEDYVAPPKNLRQGVLGSLLKLYGDDSSSTKSGQSTLVGNTSAYSSPTSVPSTPTGSMTPTGTLTPNGLMTPGGSSIFRPKIYRNHSDDGRSSRPKWYKHKQTNSTTALGGLLMGATQTFAAPGAVGHGAEPHLEKKTTKDIQFQHTSAKKSAAKKAAAAAAKKKKQERLAEQLRITVHIADVLQRQRFILRMCKALMLFGAPTHRLEEYMKMTSRVLEIDGQFLYMPGCMIVSFGDSTTHTSEMQVVRCVQGLNLNKLHETHLIYKEVVHDVVGVEEASIRLETLLASKNLYPKWLCVLFFGIASAFATMFAFKGGWADLPVSVLLSGCVGFLQIYVAPKSDLYSNVFEVTSSIIVSLLGRAFGSIGSSQTIFCFSAIAQGSLALILPGYIILCGSLELQSKNMVAGSVRMFYAIIYSLFLGFGITLGAAIYGWIDGGAVSTLTCHHTVDDKYKILFIPGYTVFVAMVNQASLRQLPIMTIIGSAGYTVTYFVGKRVSGSSEFTSAIGAFVIGVLGNIYSRVGHGLAFAAMLPAIFLQVPSGVASQGSLISGLENANELVHNITNSSTTTTTTGTGSSSNGLDLGMTMIEVSIGITVGLFVATLVVYPLGKKRSGLFTF